MGTEYNSFTDTFSRSGTTFQINADQETGTATAATAASTSREFQAATGFEVPGDVMSTARGTTGSPVVGREVQPTDTIHTHGLRMTVAMAAQMGFLSKDSNGQYTATPLGQAGSKADDAPAGQIGLASGGTAEESLAGGFTASDETEAALGTIIANTPQSTQMAALDSLIRNGGTMDDAMIGRMASHAGVEPAEMAETVNRAYEGMEKAVYDRMAPLGVYDADAFAAFIHSDPAVHQRMVESVRDLMSSNSTKGFEGLAAEFTEVADKIDPVAVENALNDAGIKFRRLPQGGVLLDLKSQGSGELTFRQAVKLGIITLRRNT